MNRERLQDIYKNTHLADKTDIESIRQMTSDYPYFHLPYVILSKYYHDTQHYKFEDMLRQAAMRVKDRQALYDYIHGRNSEELERPVEKVIEYIETEEEPVIQENKELSVHDFLQEDLTIIEQEPEYNPTEESAFSVEKPQVEEVQGAEVSAESAIEYANEPEIKGRSEELSAQEPGNHIEYESSQLQTPEKPVEFVLDMTHEPLVLDKIEIDHDIIGEEIETEFSFSRAFTHDGVEDSIQEPVNNTYQEAWIEDVNQVRKENYFKDALEPATSGESYDTPSSNMDFFAWLNSTENKNRETSEHALTGEEESKNINTELSYNQQVNRLEVEKNDDSEEAPSKLDLIDKFIQLNPQISRPKKEFFNPENMAKKSEVIDLEFVSETLANIYFEQGNYELAIRAYEKLSLQNPSKQAYFADLIEKIKNLRK